MEATFYATEGEIIKVSPRNGKDFKLEELYTLLGCDYIEVLRLDDKNIVVIDEDGKERHLRLGLHRGTGHRLPYQDVEIITIFNRQSMNKNRRKQLEEVADSLDEAKERLEVLKDEEQDAHDSMEEYFPDSEAVERMYDAIEYLESAYGDIESAIDNINEALSL